MADSTRDGALLRFQVLNSLLKQHKWMTNLCMVNFFTDNHYKQLPLPWREALERSTIEEVGELLSLTGTIKKVWPLSLYCIRSILITFSLPRIQYRNMENRADDVPSVKQTACITHHKLRYLFVKNVKPKKRYEVRHMAEETVRLAAESNVQWVLDVGSGVGHLCRLLAYGYAIRVCGVDTQEQLCQKARKLDEGLESKAKKHLSENEMNALLLFRPVHCPVTIGPNNTVQEITKILKESSKNTECPNFGIVGLHPCGDLAVTLLRAFVNCPNAKFINIVGCCYSKMDFSSMLHCSYPLSSTCAKEDLFKMTTYAGSLGCHAIETYSSRLIEGDYNHLKIHCFRAALERIIVRHWPKYKCLGLSNIRHYPELTFPEYCRKALQKLSLSVPEEDFDLYITKEDLQSWKEIVFFYSLWLLMGPAVESVILLDRLIYLREKGITGRLKAVFDPLLSPRNQILCGIKET